jgi:hypothetical protein
MTYYRRIDNGSWIMCRAVSLVGAKREAASEYRFCRQAATMDIAEEDLVVLATRYGYFAKWVNAGEMK